MIGYEIAMSPTSDFPQRRCRCRGDRRRALRHRPVRRHLPPKRRRPHRHRSTALGRPRHPPGDRDQRQLQHLGSGSKASRGRSPLPTGRGGRSIRRMLRHSPWAAGTSASQLVEHAYRLSSILWDDADVVEFASLVSRASQIRALGN